MGRIPRVRSTSGVYHITLRGNGKQILFERDEDRRMFCTMLSDCVERYQLDVLAWCLMDNHVHLLVLDRQHELSAAMHQLCSRYARIYNQCTGHVGSVFQGRFASEPVECDAHLLEAVRYIHANPEKAGIAQTDAWEWSSYAEYAGTRKACITKPDLVLNMVGGRDGFLRMSAESSSQPRCEAQHGRIPDAEALQRARDVLDGFDPGLIKTLERKLRNQALSGLRREGLSVRQIARLTGVGVRTIYRVTAFRRGVQP